MTVDEFPRWKLKLHLCCTCLVIIYQSRPALAFEDCLPEIGAQPQQIKTLILPAKFICKIWLTFNIFFQSLVLEKKPKKSNKMNYFKATEILH